MDSVDPRNDPDDPLNRKELPISTQEMRRLSAVMQRDSSRRYSLPNMSYAPFTPYSLVERGITEDNYEAMIMAMQGGQLMDVAEFADFLQNKNAKFIHVSRYPPHEFIKNETCSILTKMLAPYHTRWKDGRYPSRGIRYFLPEDKNAPKYWSVYKPGSFWYSIGAQWLFLIANGMSIKNPEFYLKTKPYIYEIEIENKEKNIFSVSTMYSYIDVMQRFSYPHAVKFHFEDEDETMPIPYHRDMLDWKYFDRYYKGFEMAIDPQDSYYESKNWGGVDLGHKLGINFSDNSLSDFDIPSGVIWDVSCIKKFRFLGKAALIDDGETYDEFANNNLKIMANSYSPWVNMEQPSIGSKMTDCYWEFHQMVWRPDPVYPWQSDYMRS